MKRVLGLAALALIAGLAVAPAQHHESPAAGQVSEHAATSEHGAAGAHEGLDLWKWANFALLAGVLGWIVKKNAGPFFVSRSREIRKALVEAEEIRAEADRRTAEVEARLANLKNEIEALRRDALEEQNAESERFQRETAAELAKIQAHAEAEIVAAGKQARLDLRRYTAQLAIGLAEQKIRSRMTPAVQNALVDSFVEHIDQPASRAQTT